VYGDQGGGAVPTHLTHSIEEANEANSITAPFALVWYTSGTMDPVSARFAQLFIAEVLGGLLCVGGLVLLFLGAAGKINIFVKGVGTQARLTNASPGVVIALVGLALVWLSLRGHVERLENASGGNAVTYSGPLSQDEILKTWTTVQPNYLGMIDAIMGKKRVERFVSTIERLPKTQTLGQIAQTEYGHPEYWPLIAAVNLDRGYYEFRSATETTPIPKDCYVEVWKVSIHYGEDRETRVQISGPAVQAANEELLSLAESNAALNIPALQDKYKAKELDLLNGEANIGDTRTLRELSIKYYGNGRFWKIIRWTNPVALKNATEETDVTRKSGLYILHFIVP
jgi:hypothetical protein